MIYDLTKVALNFLFGQELECIAYNMEHSPNEIHLYDYWVVAPLSRADDVRRQIPSGMQVSFIDSYHYTSMYSDEKLYFALFKIDNPNPQPSDRPLGI